MPPAPVRVPSQRSLAPSVASVRSVANDKGDNEMILGAVHRSPGNCLTPEENPRKPQLGDQSSPQMGSIFPGRYYCRININKYPHPQRGNQLEYNVIIYLIRLMFP